MMCVTCKKGELHPGTSTFMADKDGALFVVRGVPALVCENCGGAYFEGPVMDKLLKSAKQAAKDGVKVDIREYAAA